MAEKKYKIKVQGQLIEVSKDVYRAFYQMRRQEQAQRERDAYNHCIQYAALDSEELLGEDILLDQNALSVEEQAISAILTEKLHTRIKMLSDKEQRLICDLYFEGLSERELAQKMGLPYMTVHNRKVKVLRKLKKMMDK